MKKVGIVTIYDTNNYGNRLQNYAMQEILKKYDLDVETLKNNANTNIKNKKVVEILKRIKNFFNKVKNITNKRARYFKDFDKNINFAKKELRYENASNFENNYDYFITGSDQVWNPYFGRLTDIDLLKFAKPNKRISIAASFGVNDIDKKYNEKCSNELKKFKAISVREREGKDIINKISDDIKEVEVVLDPTMMLTAAEWEKVIKKPESLKQERYILNYFLGELDDKIKEKIERIAKENNCKIINLLDKREEMYNSGPSEFLYLIKHAFLICTDSFHSCVFSILFERPFLVIERKSKNNMSSRIYTLLNTFKLQNRIIKDDIHEDIIKIDYTETMKILQEERKKEENFIKNALDI